jgi:hypothetical protein
MKNIRKKVYFTYQEILDFLDYDGHPQFPNDKNMHQGWFTEMLDDSPFEFAVYTLSEFFPDSLINDIVNALMGIVYNRHAYDFIAYKDVDLDGDEEIDAEIFIKAFTPLINVLNNTLPRYCPLLQQNEIYSTDPVAPIGSKTTGRTRFNDTPQDEGEYNDEEHASNVSKSISETEVDSGSIMERLNEMFKNFRSIILEWSNEFNQIFLNEEQII